MSTMNDLAKRIRSSNKAYFAAGMEAGKQKVVDLARQVSRYSGPIYLHTIGGTNENFVGAE